MDSVELVSLTRNLVDIDSTTGREGDAGRWLADYLRGRGYSVREQPVDGGGRANVLATIDAPRVVFSTHFDCVPPFFPSRVEGDKVFGRGACDAKGILAAQVGAVERLRVTGVRDVGLLFVVGEERGSDGATLANELAKEYADTLGNGQPRYLINGEPTENRLGAATRGVWRVKLTASGRAAHTSRPELGESAIEKLLDALVQMRGLPLPKDEALGKTYYTVGLIDGGVAPNVVPPHAEAEVMFRTVGPREEIRAALAPLERLVAMEDVLIVPTVRLKTVPGFETDVFPYTTDIPFLSAWGQPLLYGPGSILHAHTAEEHVRIADLERAVRDNEQIARQLLAGA